MIGRKFIAAFACTALLLGAAACKPANNNAANAQGTAASATTTVSVPQVQQEIQRTDQQLQQIEQSEQRQNQPIEQQNRQQEDRVITGGTVNPVAPSSGAAQPATVAPGQ